jgi:lipoprotein-releasing system permease protein
MSPALQIALRFLTSRLRALTMSLAGVACGVGFFILTQAQTAGFEEFFIRTILGTNGALRVEDRFQSSMFTMAVEHEQGRFEQLSSAGRTYVEGIEEPDRLVAGLQQFPNVSGASIVVHGGVSVSSRTRSDSGRAYGIVLDDHLRVSDLSRQIVGGDLEAFRVNPTGVLIGRVLAERLGLQVGDAVLLEVAGQGRRYRVSAVYETGVSDIDRVRVYLHLTEARSLLKRPGGASFVQVGLHDAARAPKDAAHMSEVLGHSVVPWQVREKTWLEVFRALRYSSAITVSTIILISGLGMFNTLVMIVMEKTKEIAILRSMGYTRRDIARIFLWLGVIILVAGTVLGCLLGAGITYGVSKLPIRIRGIFSTDNFVVAWSIWHYVAATVTATVIVMTAALIPARRAARLEPGDIIRGTSQ